MLVVDVSRHVDFPPRDGDNMPFYRFSWIDGSVGALRPAESSCKGGEGLWHHAALVYFSAKGDNRNDRRAARHRRP
jgi:hypothetical protein